MFLGGMSRESKDILEILNNYMDIARSVKRIVQSYDPEARVYVFGSVVRGRYTAASDIDTLVVTAKLELKYDMMVDV